MLERFSGVLIGYNPEFDVVRQAEANINDFKNPFKDFVADTILETLKTAGLLS
jgi:hypothetical protein